MSEILKSLVDIQQRLNAPKNSFNSFGRYNYRSLESIEEAIKPLLKEHGCGIRFEDEVVEHCGRTFLKTTLHFFNIDGEEIKTTAEAEHAVEKSGMDKSQITGAASSYARKYAMNAMFAIDDNKDADTDEFHNQTNQQPQPKKKPSTFSPTPLQKQSQPALTLDIVPNDKYADIKQMLLGANNKEDLIELYNSNKALVDGNPDVKMLFGMRKAQLKVA